MNLPSALKQIERIRDKINGKRLAVFLDYDGTLTPIVDRPDQALLSDDMRQALRNLAKIHTVAIISGRKREEVESMVGLPGLIYAGSHGFDIRGPGISMTPNEVFPLIPLLDHAFEQLNNFCRDIPGSLVEHKKFAIAIHYRLVDPAMVPRMEAEVERIVRGEPRLRKTGGKMVFEIRPNIPWDKGKALLYLLKALPWEAPSVCPLYLGDDETDEDAFAVLKNKGIGIMVGEYLKTSQAQFALGNTEEVRLFLNELCQIRETAGPS